jgi:hypothetical protein
MSALQVHIDIRADGPTRIVRFSDSDSAETVEGGIVETLRRVHAIEERLVTTNQRFAALRGGAGMSRLDLFGAAVDPVRSAARSAAMPQTEGTPGNLIHPLGRTFSAVWEGTPLANTRGGDVYGEGSFRVRPGAVANGAIGSAVAMMVAGDLMVTVHGLNGVHGNVLVKLTLADQVQQTEVKWDSADPLWDSQMTFYGVRIE